jgi:hypothetical protein
MSYRWPFNSVIPPHRRAKEGMPVRREGRNVVAKADELNQWLQRTSGEAAGVHVAVPGSDLLKDLRASVAAQKEILANAYYGAFA